MAYRSFRDAEGTEWQAWDVIPRLFERRMVQRRQDGDEPEPVERRGRVERRGQRNRRAALAGLEQGWLCFEAGGEKRRLSPIPGDWPRCDDTRLREYCRAASPIRRARSGTEVMTSSADLLAQAEHAGGAAQARL